MTTSMIDWTVAASTARRLVKPGPEISLGGAEQAVAQLRASAVRAEGYVVEVTGLPVPSATAPVLVVDRPGWIQANVDGFRQVLAPLEQRSAEKLSASPGMAAVGSRGTGAEIGALLGYLAPQALGDRKSGVE